MQGNLANPNSGPPAATILIPVRQRNHKKKQKKNLKIESRVKTEETREVAIRDNTV